MNNPLTLAALLGVLKPSEEILVVHRIGPHECETVAGGQMNLNQF